MLRKELRAAVEKDEEAFWRSVIVEYPQNYSQRFKGQSMSDYAHLMEETKPDLETVYLY